jgi:prephenate dehydrogenase
VKRVAILGLGLMGGSLGLALRARGFAGRVAGYARRPDTRDQALACGAVDEVHEDPGAAVRDADLTVICVPILATADMARACAGGLKPGAVVTDVGSTKAALEPALDAALAGTHAVFIGSHPIAGSERQGMASARADLYEDATVVVTPRAGRDPSPESHAADALWQAAGARVLHMPASVHDEMLARTSHLPHMIAAVLAATVGRGPAVDEIGALCGTGFLDTTRIAAGSPTVWLDIIRTNRAALARELDECRARLDTLIRDVREHRDDDIEEFLQHAREVRNAIAPPGHDADT